ncbi:ATP-binding cassette domain-containing protein [Pirellulaceae bacterium]|jgi:sodium transport system ATP-binding protein|nr:ATP-binding cassette domain-containing protein [Pirellulaceae bacterium]
MIHVRRLTKVYKDLHLGDFVALNQLSFDALAGQIYGLLGPNGAGKTTALRILSTVLSPTHGTAIINGLDVTKNPEEVRQQIGFVSTNTAVYDRMTGWEMVEYFGRLNGMDDERLTDQMEFIFERFQMKNLKDVLGSKMSTGMKQKVSIARAMIHDPPVLIFDEATSGLDVMVAREVLKTIAQLRDQGKCIIFSTHIMREAEKLCDRIGVVNKGKLLAEGSKRDLMEEFQEDDLEELFFRLIEQHEKSAASLNGVEGQSNMEGVHGS